MAGELPTIRLSGVRGMIAQKMSESMSLHAQLTYMANVDMTAIMLAKDQLKQENSKVGIEDFLIGTIASVLQRHPEHNGYVNGKEVVLSKAIHIGVAVTTPKGLMVPIIRDADTKSLEDIAANRRDLVSRAQNGKLGVMDMTDGTFTISNLGLTRVENFTPILNSPQIAILGLGRIVKRPYVDENNEIKIRNEMGLSLTTDHRVVDGWPSGLFLTALAHSIEEFQLK